MRLPLTFVALLAGCASGAPRPAVKAATNTASATPVTPPPRSSTGGHACSAPLTTPFTVVPQGGIGGAAAEFQFSKDGRIAAAKPSLLEIQLWNVTSGNKFAVIAAATPISQWSLRPDGRMVAVVSEGHLTLVDPLSRAPTIKVAGPANVERIDWRADGKGLLATRGQETSVVGIGGAVTATIAAVAAPGAISSDGRFLFSRDGAMWDVSTNQSRWKAAGPASSVAFSDDGQFVALATGQAITVLDSATGNKRWEVPTKGGLASELALSPDGQSVAAYDNGESTERGLENRGMGLWNRGKRARLVQATDALVGVRPAFSPDGKVVGFIAGNGSEIKLADARTGVRAKQAKNLGDVRPEPPRWSADGRTLLQASTSGLAVIDMAKGDRKVIGKSASDTTATATASTAYSYRDAVWSPDDGAILVIADQGARSLATIVDLKTGTPRDTLDARTGSSLPRRFRAAEWNAATNLIALDRSDAVVVWDVRTKQPPRVIDTGDGDNTERQIAFSPQGHLLATLGASTREVKLWDPKTGGRVRTLSVAGGGNNEDGTPVTGLIEGMAFNADGTRIALSALVATGIEQSSHIAIFDTVSGALVRTLHTKRPYSYAYGAAYGKAGVIYFTPQGRGIVAVDRSGRVDLWNTATDDPPTPLLEKATGGPSTLADSGNLLLMGTPAMDVWDLRTRTRTREIPGDGGVVLGARVAKGTGAIAITRPDRVDLHRFNDSVSLTLRMAFPGVIIVADNGAFAGPTTALGPLRVRDGAETDVRSLRPNEVNTLYRPSLALDFVAGCPQ